MYTGCKVNIFFTISKEFLKFYVLKYDNKKTRAEHVSLFQTLTLPFPCLTRYMEVFSFPTDDTDKHG